jgi:hypothetical protein
MKLSDTFANRIIIDRKNTHLDCIDACMAFLDSLALDPATDNMVLGLKLLLEQIEKNNPPSRIYPQRLRFYTDEMVPFLSRLAPKGCYYGRHSVDKNLYGYWRRSAMS